MPAEAKRLITRPLRILLVLEATSAGAGQHVLNLSHGLLEQGHEVHLAWSMLRTEIRFLMQLRELERSGLRSIHVLMRPEPGLLDLGAIISVRHYLRCAGPFDIIHGHSSKGGAVARFAACFSGAARLYTPHAFKTMDPQISTRARFFFGLAEWILSYCATDAVVVSSQGEATHARSLHLPAKRLHVIHNIVRPPPDILEREEARRSFELPPDSPVLAWIGRLTAQKAPERFVELMARLRERLPTARALMLGYGELESQVRKQIAGHRLDEICRLHTNRRGWDALAAADLCVLTSRYEGMPLVLLEARSMGVPAVATDVSGVREVLAPDPHSAVVPIDDPGTRLFDATVSALQTGGSRVTPRSAEASSAFTFIQSHLALYAEVLSQPRLAALATKLANSTPSLRPLQEIGEALVPQSGRQA